jgi:hypothetical protein
LIFSTHINALLSTLKSVTFLLIAADLLLMFACITMKGALMDWQPYIKASWDLVMEAEGRTEVYLQDDLEAYLVHMMARNFRNSKMPPDIICLEFPKARTQQDYLQIGDNCLFVDAWDVKRARLVAQNYYEQMGQIAYSSAAIASRPINELYDRVAREFRLLSTVLRGVRDRALAV